MPQNFANRLLLSRQAIYLLRQAGLKELAEGDIDIHAARKIALWRQSSGAEIYLFSLLTTASRAIARDYFTQLDLQPGLSTVALAGNQHALSELTTANHSYLDCYPGEDLSAAIEPGMTASSIQTRQQLLADFFFLDALTDNPAAGSFKDLLDDTEIISPEVFKLQAADDVTGTVSGYRLFPNPVVEQIGLDLDLSENTDVTISISNFNGQVLNTQYSELVKGINSLQFDVANLTAGIYTINIFNQQLLLSKRFIKQ